MEEFITWKEEFEKMTTSSFVLHFAPKKRIDYLCYYYYCNRAGTFISKGKALKIQGSSKIGWLIGWLAKLAPCYRRATPVNTNMAIESFHRVIKVCYMEKKQNGRIDHLLHILFKISRDKVFERIQKTQKGKFITSNM